MSRNSVRPDRWVQPRRVRVHIERLVLDRLPLDAAEGEALKGALQRELTELIRSRGVSSTWQGSAGQDLSAATRIGLVQPPDPVRFGRAIGRAVHGARPKRR